MFKTIDRPANCKIRAKSHYQVSECEKCSPFEIYRQKSEGQSGPSSIRLPFVFSSQEICCQQFTSADEIKINVQNWFRSQAAEFYEAGESSSKNVMKTEDNEIEADSSMQTKSFLLQKEIFDIPVSCHTAQRFELLSWCEK
ncbi:hypothetical protein AVEN_168241-1 [Araneus ventricosus]|uniref:Uncharacterized protein n=1 Tax=Araneus ventricosus TaxID=182803 RepID=A0A4Y2LKU8_ARAVE|nr:hypothetical protein AVEN_168241-1 [Araneus ventricosus]